MRVSVTTARMNKTPILVFVLALSLAGCGSSSSSSETATGGDQTGGEEHHGEGHHGEGHHGGGHHAMSPALESLHDVLAPTWHSEPGATRAALACTNAAQLEERSRAVAAAPAEGDATTWTAQTTALTDAAAALVAECSASGPAAEERLSALHDAFHALMER